MADIFINPSNQEFNELQTTAAPPDLYGKLQGPGARQLVLSIAEYLGNPFVDASNSHNIYETGGIVHAECISKPVKSKE